MRNANSIRSGLLPSLAAGGLLLGLAPAMKADVVLFDGSVAPSAVNDIGFNDSSAGGQRIAEDFRLTAPAVARGLTFLGGYFPSNTPQADAFRLTVYADAAGLPDSSNVVAQIDLGNFGRTATGTSVFGIDLYTYTASFPGVNLAGDTRYWFTIVNDTTPDPNDDWVWAGDNTVGVWGRSFNGGVTWADTPVGSYSFVLTGTPVPEPSSLALGGVALAGAAGRRWRRRSSPRGR
jgi:hypothetical protein